MKPPPPRFPAAGHVTASARPVATAASTALPPFFRICMPVLDAMGSTETTAAFANEACSAAGFETNGADSAARAARTAINPMRQAFKPASQARNPDAPTCAPEERGSADHEWIPMQLRCANAQGGCLRVSRAVQLLCELLSAFLER